MHRTSKEERTWYMWLQAFLTIVDPRAQSMEQRDVDPQLQYPLQKFPRTHEAAPVHSTWSALVEICLTCATPLKFISRLLTRRSYPVDVTSAN